MSDSKLDNGSHTQSYLYIYSFFYILIAFTLFGRIDSDIISIFENFMNQGPYTDIPPDRQFLLEAIIPNLIGSILLSVIHNDRLVSYIWILAGAFSFISALIYLKYKQYIDWKTIYICLVFSSLVKIFFSWVGKSDPYLISLILLSTFLRSPFGRFLGAAFASLCHPQIPTISMLFLESARLMVCGRIQVSAVFGAVFGFLCSKLILYQMLAGREIEGRSEYVNQHLSELLFSGAFNALSFGLLTLAPCILLFSGACIDRKEAFKRITIFYKMPFLILLIFTFILSAFFTTDRSRVFVLTTFSAYAFLLNEYKEEIYRFLKTNTLNAFLISLLMLASPQLDFSGWRVSSALEGNAAKLFGPQSIKNRLLCRQSCNEIGASSPEGRSSSK